LTSFVMKGIEMTRAVPRGGKRTEIESKDTFCKQITQLACIGGFIGVATL
jgi:hypothetical protein